MSVRAYLAEFVFSRRFYVYFAVTGLIVDWAAHIFITSSVLEGSKAMIGYNLSLGPVMGVTMAAHSMILIGFFLLAFRGK